MYKLVTKLSFAFLVSLALTGCGAVVLSDSPIKPKQKPMEDSFEIKTTWEQHTTWLSVRKGRYKIKSGNWEGLGWIGEPERTVWTNPKGKRYFDSSSSLELVEPKLRSSLENSRLLSAEFEEALTLSPCEFTLKNLGRHAICNNWNRDGVEIWEHRNVKTGKIQSGSKQKTEILKQIYDPRYGLILETQFTTKNGSHTKAGQQDDKSFGRSLAGRTEVCQLEDSCFALPSDFVLGGVKPKAQDPKPKSVPTPKPKPVKLQGAKVGEIARVSGPSFFVKRESDQAWYAGFERVPIRTTESLKTGPDTTASLKIGSRGLVHLSKDTTIKLDENGQIELLKGTTRIQSGPQALLVKSAEWEAEMKSSDALLSHAENELKCLTLNGVINFKSEDQLFPVKSGDGYSFGLGKKQKLEIGPQEDLEKFARAIFPEVPPIPSSFKSLGSQYPDLLHGFVPTPLGRLGRFTGKRKSKLSVEGSPPEFRWLRFRGDDDKLRKHYQVLLTTPDKPHQILWSEFTEKPRLRYPRTGPRLSGSYIAWVVALGHDNEPLRRRKRLVEIHKKVNLKFQPKIYPVSVEVSVNHDPKNVYFKSHSKAKVERYQWTVRRLSSEPEICWSAETQGDSSMYYYRDKIRKLQPGRYSAQVRTLDKKRQVLSDSEILVFEVSY